MKIRKAETTDAEEIGSLIVGIARTTITKEFSPEAQSRFLASNDGGSVKKFMKSGFSYHVAESDKKIVGVIGVKERFHLYHLFVNQSHQGKGLAKRLWAVAMAESLAGAKSGIFTVNSSNEAVKLYENLGFVRTEPMQESDGVLYNPMELRVGRKQSV